MPYITSEELLAEVESNVLTPSDSSAYDELVQQVSDAIDAYCFRTFVVPQSATVRYFKSTYDGLAVDDLDDIASTTDLAVAIDSAGDGTYSSVLSSTQYAAETNRSGMVVAVRFASAVTYTEMRPNAIKLTARYGWPSVPTPVKRAALIWGIRLVNRRSSPSGIMGFAELGGLRLANMDPDVKSLLAPYRDRGRMLR